MQAVKRFIIPMIGLSRAVRVRNSAVFSLRPRTWLSFAIAPITWAMNASLRRFWAIAQSMRKPGRERRVAVRPGGENDVARLISEVNRDGIACWEGMFSQGVAAEARQHAETSVEAARAVLERLPDGRDSFREDETDFVCRYTRVNSLRLGSKDVSGGCPGNLIAETFPGDVKVVTGRDGDCYSFDNSGLHAGSHGRRETISSWSSVSTSDLKESVIRGGRSRERMRG